MRKEISRFLSLLLCLVIVQVMVFPDFAVAQASQRIPSIRSLPRCPVGADPVNKDRQPAADEEIIINPADQSIKYESGNGQSVDCNLQAGVPVVVSKATGVAKWVYGCGNNILSQWVPKRAPAQEVAAQNPPPPAAPKERKKLEDVIPQEMNVHVDVSGEVDVRHSGTVALEPSRPLAETYGGNQGEKKKAGKKWCGKGCKIGFVVLGVGTAVGVGAAFSGRGGSAAANQSSSGGPPPFPRN